ncbi:MAG: histidine kinase [Acidobacteriia bacterium]|nr:histidine kinase [Terriglobia bacterium]
MHPLLAGRLRILLYLVLWAGIGALLTGLFSLLGRQPVADAAVFAGPLTLVYAFACLSAWWVCRSRPIGSAPPWRLGALLAGAALQSASVWTAVGAGWAAILKARAGIGPDRGGIVRELAALFVSGVVLYAQSLVAHYLALAFESARAAERRLLESELSAREAELKALRAQLNPHFLFNSLNSISALVGSDPEAARRMCHLLGDFLRTSLALGARPRVALREELALAEHYLAVEKVRYGPRLAVERDVEAAAERCLVPPLLLQPLVENAVKHGVASRVEGGTIRITARRRAGHLEVTIENPFDPDAPPRRGQGVGLDNVRRRIEALDPGSAGLRVTREGGRFRAMLYLPAFEPEADRRAPAREARRVGGDARDEA